MPDIGLIVWIIVGVFFILLSAFLLVIVFKQNDKEKRENENKVEFNALYRDIRAQEDEKGVLKVALSSMMRLFPKSRRGLVITFDKDGYSNIIVTSGYAFDSSIGKIRRENTFYYKKCRQLNPEIYNDVVKEPDFLVNSRYLHENKHDFHTVTSILYFPIRINMEVTAVMAVFSLDGQNDFSKKDKDRLVSIQGNFSRLVEYALMAKQLEVYADTDELTGIDNRQALMKDLDISFADIKSNMDTYSFVMMDLDNFKSINDTYGHVVGDKALVHFAAVINSFISDEDFCARYGGDEFVIGFKNLNKEASMKRMEDIRELLKKNPVDGNLAINFSYGIIILDSKADLTVKYVFDEVDKIMYHDKKSRKDVVMKD